MRLLRFGSTAFITKTSAVGIGALGVFALLQFPGHPAQAQLLDQLKGAMGSGQGGSSGGALGGLGGGMPAVDQASPGNTAGVLQYCIRNNYVDGGAASSVKNSIVSKLTGSGQSANDSGFKAGNNGMLQTGNGHGFSLGGSGINAQVTQKVCGLVLQHAKSLL
jgi:hypothetical protein